MNKFNHLLFLMKAVFSYIIPLLLLAFFYQNIGHELLSDFNVLYPNQLETPMGEPIDESEREIEEKEVECLKLHSLLDELTDLMNEKHICCDERSRNLIWLEHQTPPPKV